MTNGRGDEHDDSGRIEPQSGIDYRELYQSLSDAVVLADADSGTILEANRAACHLVGMSRDQMVGLHQSRLHPSRDAQKHAVFFEESVSNGCAVIDEIRVRRPSGELVPVEMSATVLEVSGRRVARTLLHRLDTSERTGEGASWHIDQLAALSAIATTVAGSLHPEEIMDRALSTALDVMGLEAGAVVLLSVAQEHMSLAAHRGLGDRLVQLLREIPVDLQLSETVYSGNTAILMKHLSQDRQLAHLAEALEEEGQHSLVAVPLLAWEKGLAL